jgi:hypothetical protein
VLLLELATLRSMDKFYDYEKKTVDVNGLRRMAEDLPMSGTFRDLLLCMLLESEEERVGLLSLKEMVPNLLFSSWL